MKKHILIVEDDDISFTVGKMFFDMHECDIDRAVSGEQAMDLFVKGITNKKPYDAIYMDLGLPNMSGIETCKVIRQYELDSNVHHVTIIAVTANDNDDTINECLSAGMTEVYFKPLTAQKISDFLSKCN